MQSDAGALPDGGKRVDDERGACGDSGTREGDMPAVANWRGAELGSVFAASSASSAGVCASYPDDINKTGILLVTGAITLSPPNGTPGASTACGRRRSARPAGDRRTRDSTRAARRARRRLQRWVEGRAHAHLGHRLVANRIVAGRIDDHSRHTRANFLVGCPPSPSTLRMDAPFTCSVCHSPLGENLAVRKHPGCRAKDLQSRRQGRTA